MVATSQKTDLRDTAFVVTGAAQGIGQVAATSLAREGAQVALLDIKDCSGTKNMVENRGGTAITFEVDVTDAQAVHDAIGTIHQKWEIIHGLVTAAGIVERSPIDILSLEQWNNVIGVNLTGTFLVIQSLYPIFKTQKFGKIVCIGSVAAKVGGVIAGPAYVASKGGIHGLIKWVAKDSAKYGIHANVVAPGPIRTAMIAHEPYSNSMAPLERLGEPEDIAEAIVYLASQASNWVTGHILDVNGGILMD